jgi:2'-5' RNA ligase
MRLFLGIEIPEENKNQIDNYLRPLHQSEKGWEKAHDYHQTLLFIGETTDHSLELIKAQLRAFTFYPFTLNPTQFYFFNRRIMFLGFEQSEDLLKLKKRVNESFADWPQIEKKPFLPHVTVKRWQRYEFDHLSSGLNQCTFNGDAFQVSRLSLFLSEKDSDNNKYHVIFSSDQFDIKHVF